MFGDNLDDEWGFWMIGLAFSAALSYDPEAAAEKNEQEDTKSVT